MIGNIHVAQNDNEYSQCIEFLSVRGIKVLRGTVLFYIAVDNEVKAVAGWNPDLGGTIEPLESDHVAFTRTIGTFMYGLMIGKGYSHVSCWTKKEAWREILEDQGFTVCESETTRLVQSAFEGGN